LEARWRHDITGIMAALIAVLLVLTPFGIYVLWRRFGPASGEPSSAVAVGLLLMAGLMLGGAAWFGLSRSFERGEAYVPAVMGTDGTVQQGHAEHPR
jgi:hypothetical protein